MNKRSVKVKAPFMTTDTPLKKARDLSKAQSRARLIDAAATSIHRHGMRGATIGEIQAISNLSRGMISLHFRSKENLLLAVAEHLANAYDAHMEQAINAAGSDPKEQLLALFRADLDPKILNSRDVSIWFSFRAEGHANPQFQTYIGTRSGHFARLLMGICKALTPIPHHPANAPALAASALMSLLEGIWTDFHLNPDNFNREEALQTCLYVADRLFADQPQGQ